MTALTPVPVAVSASQSLYAIEEHLAALADTADLVTPAEAEEFRKEFQLSLASAVDKRDRVGQFMSHLEQQIAFASAEINRLKERKALYERAFERIEEYVISTIESLGRDARGKFRKLEGKTINFSLAGCPPSVEILDEESIPLAYKVLTIRIPQLAWDEITASVPATDRDRLLGSVRSRERAIDKRAVAAAIQNGNSVPGADLEIGKNRLRRS
jgi:hypothetical protein